MPAAHVDPPRLIISKYEGWCKSCHAPIKVGDRVLWAKGAKGVWCKKCQPSGPYQPSSYAPTEKPEPPKQKPASVNGLPLAALSEFEEAFLTQAEKDYTPQVAAAWRKYKACLERAKRPGLTKEEQTEARTALRVGFIELAKVVI